MGIISQGKRLDKVLVPVQTTGASTTDVMSQNATTTALGLKAPLTSPALTGTPTAPTAAVNTNTAQLATTAFVNAEIANSGGINIPSAPTTSFYGGSGVAGKALALTQTQAAQLISGYMPQAELPVLGNLVSFWLEV
ncbi:hypothetical protein FACS189465_3370 [Clostridia bacterium]|nr:hypothetical protein FACS189465_3370 [Clostridia bacterium]